MLLSFKRVKKVSAVLMCMMLIIAGNASLSSIANVTYAADCGTLSFGADDPDLDYSSTSITRTVCSASFTLSGGVPPGDGLGYDEGDGGIYAYDDVDGSGTGGDVKLTIRIAPGYTFDITSFQALASSGNIAVQLTYANDLTTTISSSGISDTNLTTISSFSSPIDDVKQIVVSSTDFAVFQDFVFADVKPSDTTPPILSAVGNSNVTQTTATLNAMSNEAGTMYYVVTTSSTAPSAAQIKAGQNEAGAVAIKSGNGVTAASIASNFSVTDLTAGTTYYVYFVAIDNSNNSSSIASTSLITAPLTYTIAALPNVIPDELTAGYAPGTQETTTVTLTRTGTGDLTGLTTALSGANASNFTITQPSVTALNSGTPSTTFTVKANDGLAAGTYMDTVTVTAANMAPASFTVTQVVNALPTVTGVSSSALDGSYTAGAAIPIYVTFSDPVIVQGTPQLQLETGSVDRMISYSSGSGTSTLRFNYTVQAGETSSDLDYASTAALTLNGGQINGAAGGKAAVLTLAAPGAAGSLGANKALVIDTEVPTVSGVAVPSDATYTSGQALSFMVIFNENVTVNTAGGVPRLALTVGSSTVQAQYNRGSGTSALVFTYIVQPGDQDNDGLSVGTIALNGGTMKDAAGNDANLTLNSVGSTANVKIDAITPAVTSVSSAVPDGSYHVGAVIPISVTFSEPVIVQGTPQLQLETGTNDRVINYSSGSGTSTLTFDYTVQMGDTTSDLDYTSSGALALNGGQISDASGNAAVLTLPAPGTAGSLGANKALVIVPPTYTIGALSNETPNALTAGYAPGTQETKTVSVTRTGTGDLASLTTALSGANASSFTITQPLASTLDSGMPSTTFTVKANDGLAAGTYTATVTVTAANMTPVTFTVTQVVNVPLTYTIGALSNETPNALTAGYAPGTQETRTVTVTRTGTGDLTSLTTALSGANASSFTITQPLATTLDSGMPSTTFTVKANDGLPAGTYTATVTVTAANMTPVTFTVTQVVNVPLTYMIGALSNETSNALTEGYAPGTQETTTVTVTRTGTGDLTSLTTVLSGANASSFTITQPLAATLDSLMPSTTFTVKAKDGLAAGTYTATVSVTAANMTPVTFTVTQVVNVPLTYTIGALSNETPNALTAGYAPGTQETKTVTITRTGTGDLASLATALSGANASSFTITQPLATTLDSGMPSTTFTVKANDGLAAGTYTATVIVTAANMTPVTFTVTQVVTSRNSGGTGGGPISVDAPPQWDIDQNGVMLDSDRIDTTKPSVTLEVTPINGAAYVSIPISVLTEFAKKNDAFIIEIKTPYGSYQVPVNLVSLVPDLQELLAKNNLKAEEISFKITLSDKSGDKDIQAAFASGLPQGQVMGAVVDFHIDIVNTKTGHTIGMADKFSQALTRIIPIPQNVTVMPGQWGAFRYNETTKRFEFVAAKSVQIDGTWYVMIRSYSNSVYAVAANEVSFADTQKHWSQAFVQLAAAKGLVEGVGGGSFAPNQSVTRAEFTAMLVRALSRGVSTSSSAAPFSDVKPDAWYAGEIAKAKELGLLTFVQGRIFHPNLPITREEMASMLAAAVSLEQPTLTQGAANLDGFKDIGSVNANYLKDVRLMVNLHIMLGTSAATFSPQGSVTRAEAATVLVRTLQTLGMIN